jgi:hypothetical protein
VDTQSLCSPHLVYILISQNCGQAHSIFEGSREWPTPNGPLARLYLALEFPPHDRKPGLPSSQSSVAGLPQVRSETGQSLRHATDRMALIHIERITTPSSPRGQLDGASRYDNTVDGATRRILEAGRNLGKHVTGRFAQRGVPSNYVMHIVFVSRCPSDSVCWSGGANGAQGVGKGSEFFWVCLLRL